MASASWRTGDVLIDDRHAEHMAAHAMRSMGYADARVTPVGPDAGVDVVSSRAIAQVKFRGQRTGRADVQRLVGARRRSHHLDLLFFSASGYSAQAIQYATEMDVALFSFTSRGALTPHSPSARRMPFKVSQELQGAEHEGAGLDAVLMAAVLILALGGVIFLLIGASAGEVLAVFGAAAACATALTFRFARYARRVRTQAIRRSSPGSKHLPRTPDVQNRMRR